jgi:signal transduction histidine kinase
MAAGGARWIYASGWRLWAAAVGTLLLSGLLLDPFRRFATRLVYPGSSIAEDRLDNWRVEMGAADSLAVLEEVAARELSAYLNIPVLALVDRDGESGSSEDGRPVLRCIRREGRWRSELVGWDAAPPGPRHVAHLFGTLLAEAARTLDQAIAFANRERDLQKQARLAELGALAATVAHDIRNPLNIIVMAAAGAPSDVRSEISQQTARISQLASDLLDYAKPWRIDPVPLDLGDHVRAMLSRYHAVEVGPGLSHDLLIDADPRRLAQALGNLLDNAVATRMGGREVRIVIDADADPAGLVRLHLCDDGPGIPSDIKATLFQPFVSRSPNGTGLGLAIVAKIMEAHGGSAGLSDRPDWSTCFTLTFPARRV